MLNQSLIQKNEQTLTARQIQQIKLLELPIQEIEERIKNELEDNPALEEGAEIDDESKANEDDATEDDLSKVYDISLDDYASTDDIPDYKLSVIQEVEVKRDMIPFAATAESFGQYLLTQIQLYPLTDRQRILAPFVIGNISEDGYLRRTDEELADDYTFSTSSIATAQEMKDVRLMVQRLDPPGIAAADLRDCLLLQLNRLPHSPTQELSIRIINKRFADFANKRFDKLKRDLKLTAQDLHEVESLILHLNPKPGHSIDSKGEEVIGYIRPDFRVEEADGDLFVSVCGARDIPPLRVNPSYREMIQDYKAHPANRTPERRKAITFAREKLEKARWFIEAIRQRQDTLRRTMQAIVQMQQDFFRSGLLSDLRPMVLRDIAEITQLDISTISRVTSNKYVETDFGFFPLKYFFTSALSNSEGQEVSNREVERIIALIVANEDKQTPLTDQELQDQLALQGYNIARRTVAKYRLRLGLPTARLRRSIIT